MSIYTARLRNTSNASNVRQTDTSSGPAWIVPSQQLDHAYDQAVNSKQKMHWSQRCYGKLEELAVDDFWQIADAGDQELWRLAHSSRRGTLEFGAKDNDGLHSKLVLHSLTNNYQPVQVTVHQPWQTTFIFQGPCDQTCCSILNVLQLVCDLRRVRQKTVAIVNARCDKGID